MKNRENSIRLSSRIVLENPSETMAMHPHKFILWLFIVSIIMLFSAFTSAYIVKQSDGNWLLFELPSLFWVNSVVLVLSSATMHWAYLSAKKDRQNILKIAVSLTVLLGGAFLVGQYFAWVDLYSGGVFFGGAQANAAGSFLYVLTGAHAFHLVTGVLFLAIVFYAAFVGKIHSKNLTRIEMCATYWHFLDILWIYLFAFLLLNQ
jgi:cytochrome c oxidase subunit 3